MGKYDYFKSKKISFLGKITHKLLNKRIISILRKEIVSQGKVFEIGPGVGGLAKEIIKNGFNYQCIDRSTLLVEYLRSLDINALHGDVPPLPCENSSLDCVIMINVFEHTADSEKAISLLSEINRVLKPDGKLVFIVPNYNGWGMDLYEVDYTHTFITSPERIKQVLSDTAFRILQMNVTYGCVKGLHGLVLDIFNNSVCSFLHMLFPLNSKILKAKILFHPEVWIVAGKE